MLSNKLKINLVGDTMVGKTTILGRMKTGTFDADSMVTVGASFVMLRKENLNFEVWDTAGQERYLSLIPMYFRDVKIVLFVFDVNIIKSIKYINKYKNALQDKPNVRIIILGNKTDLLKKEYSLEELTLEVNKNFEELELTDKVHGLYFISAKDGNNFDKFLEHFYESAKTLPLDNVNLGITINNLYNDINKNVDKDEHVEDKNRKCC